MDHRRIAAMAVQDDDLGQPMPQQAAQQILQHAAKIRS